MTNQSLTIKQVNFNGDNLLAVKDNSTGKVHVAVNHICNALGLDADKQRAKLREHMTLSKGTTIWGVPSNGGIQDTFVIELDFLPLWLAGINPAKVNIESQDKLVEYQLKAKDVLAAEFVGQAVRLPQSFAEALRLAADLEEERLKLLPKAESFDTFISGENVQDMNTAAKTLGWGRNRLFARLRSEKILMASNEPFQTYIERGYFEVKEKPIKMGGQVINKPQTYVTPKGIDWLSKRLN